LLIDTHAHIDSERFAGEREAMLRRAWAAGVGTILAIGIGDKARDMEGALHLCRRFNGLPDLPRLFASAGVYPHSTPEIDNSVLAKLDTLLAEPEVIACGEIGLDYYHEGAPHAIQKQQLIAQLEVAASHQKPILIHCRPKDGQHDAWDDLFEILDQHWAPTRLGGIMHCFSGTYDQAMRSIEMGFLISLAGSLSFAKAQELRDVAARLPLESLVVETDAPYLAPVPYRGKRNESAFVVETARLLADLLGVTLEELTLQTTKNFHRLFAMPQNVGNC